MKNETAVCGLSGGAKVAKKSVSYLRILADRGEVPSFRDDSGKRLFLRSDLEEYAKKNGKSKLKFKAKG